MNYAILVPVVLCAAISTLVVSAKEPPTAEQIMDRSVEVTGGEEAYRKLKTRKRTGSLTAKMGPHPAYEATVKEYAVAPNRFRLEIAIPNSLEYWLTTDGELSWQVNSRDGMRQLEGDEANQVTDRARFHGPAAWREQYKQVEFVEEASWNEIACYRIDAINRWGHTVTNYYDVNRGFLVGQTQSLVREGERYDIETTFENYRKFDGVTLPCKITQVMADIPGIGEGRQTWVFDKTLHNIRIDPKKFERPTELANDE